MPNQSVAFSSGKVRPNHETNINIIARRTGKDVNSHTVLDGIITTIMATIQRINIIGSREGSRNRRRLKARSEERRGRERGEVRVGGGSGRRRHTRSVSAFLLNRSSDLFSSGKVRPNHETNINIIARRTGKDVNSHTVLDGIITTIMATIQRINIIGSREGSRNRRRLKANQTGKKFRVGIKSNISTNRNNLISGVDRCIHLNAMKKTTITSINRQTIKI